MAPDAKLLSLVLLLCIFSSGNGQRCGLSSVEVQQTNTGLKVGYDPVFEVEVKNLCRCTVAGVTLSSQGFASSMPVDPKVFAPLGNGDYLVDDGRGIPSSQSFRFRYSWDRYYKMTPAGFQADCP